MFIFIYSYSALKIKKILINIYVYNVKWYKVISILKKDSLVDYINEYILSNHYHSRKKLFTWKQNQNNLFGKLARARIMKCHKIKVTINLSINYFLIIDLYLKCVGSNIIGKQGYILKFVLME